MIYNVISSSLKPVERHYVHFFYKTDKAALTKLLVLIIFIFFYNTLHPLQKQSKKKKTQRHCTRCFEYCRSHIERMNVLVRLPQAHWQRFSHRKLG